MHLAVKFFRYTFASIMKIMKHTTCTKKQFSKAEGV